tara:strand:- start:133 stop:324 length:192 start_codon:yes stop_codon:yes gene_type:complete
VTFGDVKHCYRLAAAPCGQYAKLARATKISITVGHLLAVNIPINHTILLLVKLLAQPFDYQRK